MPASSWAMPPKASARPSTTGWPLAASSPALNMLNTSRVSPKEPSPSGAGSAIAVPVRVPLLSTAARIGSSSTA